jgi:hypothetical protein
MAAGEGKQMDHRDQKAICVHSCSFVAESLFEMLLKKGE